MPLISLLRAFARKSPSHPGTRVRVAVIGAGRMGRHHVHQILRNPRAQLVAVVDADASRAQAAAGRSGAQALTEPGSVLGKVQAAIIATPTKTHAALGQVFLSHRISCLIEKPLASTVEEADELTALAESHGCILQVGHIERFNAAVVEAAKFIRAPKFIEVNRLGPYDPRIADVGVVMDLMIHDLDIILFLVGEKVKRVEAFGAKVLSDYEDIAKVRLHFENGCIADLSASRVSIKKYRTIRIFQKDAYLSLDYAAPQLKIYRKKSEIVRALSDIERLSPKLSHEDPLWLEQDHFLDCVQTGQTPLVTGRHGRDALELAREVLDNLKIHA